MILELEPRRDTETPSRTHNERICETTSEETSRTVPPGATGDPEPPAGRPPGIHTLSTLTSSGRRCRRGCASWQGSSLAPTWSGRLAGRRAMNRRSPALDYCQRRGCVVSTALEDQAVSVAGLCAVNEAANQPHPTGLRREEGGGTGLPFQPQCGKGARRCSAAPLVRPTE